MSMCSKGGIGIAGIKIPFKFLFERWCLSFVVDAVEQIYADIVDFAAAVVVDSVPLLVGPFLPILVPIIVSLFMHLRTTLVIQNASELSPLDLQSNCPSTTIHLALLLPTPLHVLVDVPTRPTPIDCPSTAGGLHETQPKRL
jgi:hypothetical protein